MVIRIKGLRLRTIIGVRDWERRRKQDVVLNVSVTFDGARAAETDRLRDTLDYCALRDRIVAAVEASRFRLIEALAGRVLALAMEDPRVSAAEVEVEKPGALRFADAVSVTCSAERPKP
jgi:FolB domain-containing protein